jgi:hypothetical protein
MTEADWNSCTDPTAMLAFLRGSGKASDRKFRLLAVCCWPLIRREGLWQRLHRVVQVAGRYADGQAARQELLNAKSVAWSLAHPILRLVMPPGVPLPQPRDILLAAYAAEERTTTLAERLAEAVAWPGLREAAPALLREVFGPLPFRTAAIDPLWLAWNERCVARLAETAYQNEAFDLLPLLGDALEDAGCADGELLGHLHRPGPHCRGCWALDRLLGKG